MFYSFLCFLSPQQFRGRWIFFSPFWSCEEIEKEQFEGKVALFLYTRYKCGGFITVCVQQIYHWELWAIFKELLSSIFQVSSPTVHSDFDKGREVILYYTTLYYCAQWLPSLPHLYSSICSVQQWELFCVAGIFETLWHICGPNWIYSERTNLVLILLFFFFHF